LDRILPVSAICRALWASQTLRLGSRLSESYVARLTSEGLAELAANQSQAQGEPGGITDEDADKHFALRFVNSAGRSQCAVLDPHDKLGTVSNSLLAPTLGDGMLLVDVPCGAGACGLALLECIRELRSAGSLPVLPLNVRIVAGDISVRAREHYRELFDVMKGELAKSAIFAELIDIGWDVSDARQNAKFVDSVVTKSEGVPQILIIASNFSDAMADAALLESFRHFLSQLIGRVSDWPTTVCWIEPQSNKAKKYLPPISKWVVTFMAWLKPDSEDYVECGYQLHDPVTNKPFQSGIAVLQCSSKVLV
jgi:hypothetical protein